MHRIPDLPEPMPLNDFDTTLADFLHSKLGPVDVSDLLARIYEFADFSHDGKVKVQNYVLYKYMYINM